MKSYKQEYKVTEVGKMIHTKAFYEERREKRVAQRKEYKDNRSEEKEAYRKLFNEAQKEEMARR
jgi:hypothetical protein